MSGYGKWASPEDLVGSVLERRYEVVRLLGMGGMGAVYEGRHVRLDKRVAIKVLSPTLAADDTQRRRFLREARAANRIAHQNVVEILDFGEEPVTYFVMEYLEGADLHELISAAGALPWARARSIFLQILSALEAAHGHGIVHRDMKPSNCFLPTQRDGRDVVKVLDFGIAKVAESSPETRGLTRTHEVMGTVNYMAPEQALAHAVDARTDVYAVGVLLFEMLTGTVPFEGTNSYQVLDKHVRSPPPPPRSINPAVPEAVEFVILRALEKDPANRFQSMADFITAIELIDGTGFSSATQPLAGALQRRAVPSPPTELLDQSHHPPMAGSVPPTEYLPGLMSSAPESADAPAPAPIRARVPAPTGPPDTSPSRPATTDPTVSFSDERRRSATTMIALVVVAAAVTIGSAVGLGWYLAAQSDDGPDRAAPKTDEKAAETRPAPQPDEEPAAELVIADAEASKNPAPAVEVPVVDAVVTPAPTVEPRETEVPEQSEDPAPPTGKRTRGSSKTKAGKADADSLPPPAETVLSVMSKLKKKAVAQCKTGVVGGNVVVTFLIRPDGRTTLVKASEPNHRSTAGSCVAELVKAAQFPTGNDGRKTLSVIFS